VGNVIDDNGTGFDADRKETKQQLITQERADFLNPALKGSIVESQIVRYYVGSLTSIPKPADISVVTFSGFDIELTNPVKKAANGLAFLLVERTAIAHRSKGAEKGLLSDKAAGEKAIGI
jgi:hypothetical protein